MGIKNIIIIVVLILAVLFLVSSIVQHYRRNMENRKREQRMHTSSSNTYYSPNSKEIYHRPPTDFLSSEEIAKLRDLKSKGRYIEAVKRFREKTGMGLVDAKNYIDTL